MKLKFADVTLSLISYGSALCLGVQAETPLPESNLFADKKASAELAKEAIDTATNRFYNAGVFNGEAVETHERFSYFAIRGESAAEGESALLKGLENLLIIQDQSARRSPGWKHASKKDIAAAALEFFAAIPRESSFLSRLTLRNQEGDLNPSKLVDVCACGELWDSSAQ